MRAAVLSALALSLGLPAGASQVAHAPPELPLQQATQRALAGRAGAVVALDARNGRLKAVVNPRAAAGTAYPVGSLAKLVTALAAMEAGVTDGARRYPCKGGFERWTCWRVHGDVTLEEAIAQSCSSAFFAIGRDLGGLRLNRAFSLAGFGHKTESDLAIEASGRFLPARTRAEITELAYGGTSALQATPLQVASLMGAIANGGTRYAPGFAPDSPRVLGRLLGAHALGRLHAGMRRAVLTGSATGADVSHLAVHGKTGTAAWSGGGNRRHGWFAGFAEERVVVVFIKEGTGYEDAAPIAREVFAAWL